LNIAIKNEIWLIKEGCFANSMLELTWPVHFHHLHRATYIAIKNEIWLIKEGCFANSMLELTWPVHFHHLHRATYTILLLEPLSFNSTILQ
jgi:hypothetical protein